MWAATVAPRGIVSAQPHATVSAWAWSYAERIVPNEWFEAFIETSDEWIRERTGIRERHFAADGQTTSDLATDAATRALEAVADRAGAARPPHLRDADG